MRVALVRELAGIGSVELRERPDPTPAAGQAAVRVRGAGVGPWDVAIISGTFGRPALPYIRGLKSPGSSTRWAKGPTSGRAIGCTRIWGLPAGGLPRLRWQTRAAWRACPRG
jgi:hypothetical protein